MRHRKASLLLKTSLLAGLIFVGRAGAQTDPETVTVPLTIYNASTDGGTEYKVGIPVTLGSDGVERMYEFDTGGTGFVAAYSSTIPGFDWSSTSTGITVSSSYTSGNQYSSSVVDATVSLSGMTNTGSAVTVSVGSAAVGQIVTATNALKPSSSVNSWFTDLGNGTPPLDTFAYGDFGMDLAVSATGGLESILPQLSGSLSNGFVINLGAYPGASTPEGAVAGQNASLQIGLTAQQRERSSWAQVIEMVPATGTYANSGANLYAQVLSTGTLTLSGTTNSSSVVSSTSVPTGIVYDTGAPTTEIHTGTDGAGYALIGDYLVDGVGGVLLSDTVTLTGSNGPTTSGTIIDVASGVASGSDEVNTSTANAPNWPGIYTNTGIVPFWGNEVVFDVADGFIGIGYAVPEPNTTGLLLLGLSVASLAIGRRHSFLSMIRR